MLETIEKKLSLIRLKKYFSYLVFIALALATYRILNTVQHSDQPFRSDRYDDFQIFIPFILILFFISLKIKNYLLIWLSPLAIIIITNKGQAALSTATFFISSTLIGVTIFDYFSSEISERFSKLERYIISYLIGFSLLSYLDWYLLHFTIHYSITYYASLFLIILIQRKQLSELINYIKIKIHEKPNLNTLLLFFFSVVLLVYVLCPIHIFEDLNGYLHIAKLVSINGRMNFSPTFVISLFNNISAFPFYTINYILGGEYACRLTLFLNFLLTGVALYSYSKRKYNKIVSRLVLLTFFSIPVFLASVAGLFSDPNDLISGVGLLIYTLVLLEEKLSAKGIFLFFIISALTFMLRLQTSILIFPLSLLILIKVFQQNDKARHLFTFFGGSLFFALIFTPTLIYNFLKTGNPLFPNYNDIFKSEYFFPIHMQKAFLGATPPSLSFSLLEGITFYNDDQYLYSAYHRFGIGFLFYMAGILSPLMLFIKKYRTTISKILFIVVFGFILHHIVFFQLRYLYSIIPAAILWVGLTFYELTNLNLKRFYSFYVYITFSIIFFLGYLFQFQGNNMIDFPFPLTALFKNDFSGTSINKWLEVKKFFNAANTILDKNQKVLMHYTPANYFADFKVEGFDWYFYSTQQKIMKTEGNPKETYHLIFDELNFNAIILTYDDFFGLMKNHYLEPKLSYAGYTLWMPKQKFKLGEQIYFGTNQRGNDFLLSGWHAPEPGLVWTKDSTSTIQISNPLCIGQNLKLTISINPYVYKNIKQQHLIININGSDLYEGTFNKPHEIAITVPKTLNTSGEILITLKSPNSVSPRESGLDINDNRKLAFQLHSIKIE